MEKIVISRKLSTAMFAHAAECLPEECCGLAGGKDGRITDIVKVENALHSPTEFRMEAGGQIPAMARFMKDGKDLLAIYHSHPDGPETPSQTDLSRNMYPEIHSIILAKNNGIWSMNCYQIHSSGWKKVMILIDD